MQHKLQYQQQNHAHALMENTKTVNVIYKQNKINSVPAVFDILELRWHKGHSVKMYLLLMKK